VPPGGAGPPGGPGPPGPLAGIRVLEFAGLGPAPLACTLLADLGAEVLRIVRAGEPPGGADGLAHGRPALSVDLKDADAVRDLLGILDRVDVLVEGYRPGTLERLGLGPDVCLARNPRLVYARMTGWGQSGPLAARAGHDINYLSLTGALHAIGGPDKPVPPLNLIADFGGGSMFLVVGVLAALLHRGVGGAGQVVDAAMVDGASYLMTMLWRMFALGAWSDHRAANLLDGGAPFYDSYECADGKFVAVGALESQFFRVLVERLGMEAVPAQLDRASWPALRNALAAAFRARPRDEWAAMFADLDACVTPVLSLDEAPHHPHLAARGTLTMVDGQVLPAPAPRFSASPTGRPEPSAVPSAADLLRSWGVEGSAADPA